MRVQDLMTKPVIGIAPSASIAEAVRVMAAHRISGLPVIDAQHQIVGVITEGDFLRRAELGTEFDRPRWRDLLTSSGKLADEYVHSHGRRVDEIMSPNPVTISAGALLGEAVETMLAHHVKRLPVLDKGELVGIISRSDLMRAAVGALPTKSPETIDDSKIRDAVLAEMARQKWTSTGMTRVRVKQGVVELEGMIFDERQRTAMKVAAENVPGVRAVSDHLVWIEPFSGMVVLSPQDRGLPPAGGEMAKPAA